LYDILHKKLTAQLENNKVGETAKKKISELNRQIELLEERFVLKKLPPSCLLNSLKSINPK
jgi:hypothetical protein